LAEPLIVSAPATSANLGPGFDALAVALDLANTVRITRRPGPLEVRVSGESARVESARSRARISFAIASTSAVVPFSLSST